MSSFIVTAADGDSEGGRKSSQGLARDMTEVWIEWVFMKESFWEME